MNKTQQMKRRPTPPPPPRAERPAAAMPGHALALAWKHNESHKTDAHNMHVYARLRTANVKPEARMRLLAFG